MKLLIVLRHTSKVIAGIRNHVVELTQEVINNLQSIQRLSQQQIQAYQSQNEQYLKLIQKFGQSPNYECLATFRAAQVQHF